MPDRRPFGSVVLAALFYAAGGCQSTPATPSPTPTPTASIDSDLLDVTVPTLRRLYEERKYTVTQVVQWHLDRIDRYNGIYAAIETVFRNESMVGSAKGRIQRRAGST